MSVRLILGDVREKLAELPDESVHCVVTSPPYFGLRDYGVAGQIGLEPTPDAFVLVMVEVFREVRRVLRKDGTLWLNLGDSYAASTKDAGGQGKQHTNAGSVMEDRSWRIPQGLKPKDLIGVPWRVAFALQADGWYLRQDIIWAKPNPMPESVTDRCTKAHEYLFLLSKSARYFYDGDAIREPHTGPGVEHYGTLSATDKRDLPDGVRGGSIAVGKPREYHPDGRNRRSVWTVATQSFKEAHFATFPPDLIEPCIKAGCPKDCCAKCGAPVVRQVERTAMVLDRSERTHDLGRTRSSGTMLEPPTSVTTGWSRSCSCGALAGTVRGTVLDPFGGAGTTGLVADRLQRDAILIELNPAYAALARTRIQDDALLFAEVV